MNSQDFPFCETSSPGRPLRWLIVKNLVLEAHIGVYAREHGRKQRVRICVYCAVADLEGKEVGEDRLDRTVSYDDLVAHVQDIVEAGHIELVETLAERIARAVLGDKRVEIVRISVEKLDVVPQAESVGVMIERHQSKRTSVG